MVLENGWVGETSYMHILGQCSLCALCGATAATKFTQVPYLRVNVGALLRRGAIPVQKFGGMMNV